MKLFADLEFTRLHQRTSPISMGLVTEDGKSSFYCEFTDFDPNQVDDWLKENIFPLLDFNQRNEEFVEKKNHATFAKGTRDFIVCSSGGLIDWINSLSEQSYTFASFGLSYDLVLFRELFIQTKTERPRKLTAYNYDVSTLFQEFVGDPTLPFAKEKYLGISPDNKHNALFDAEVARDIYKKIKSNLTVI